MNELKFLEAIGKIDGDLIKEADVEKIKTFPKCKIYAFGSAAAVAMVAFGSVLLFNSYGQSGSVVDNSVIQKIPQMNLSIMFQNSRQQIQAVGIFFLHLPITAYPKLQNHRLNIIPTYKVQNSIISRFLQRLSPVQSLLVEMVLVKKNFIILM